MSDSDDLNDRSNGDRGDAEPDGRRADKAYKYNFMVTFGELAVVARARRGRLGWRSEVARQVHL